MVAFRGGILLQQDILVIEMQHLNLKEVLQPDAGAAYLEETTANVGDGEVPGIARVVHRVGASIALQIIVAGGRKDRVVAVAPEDCIVSQPAGDRIVATQALDACILSLASRR